MKLCDVQQLNLTVDIIEKKYKTLALTAAHSGDGVTTCSYAFAQGLLRQTHAKVLVVQFLPLADEPKDKDWLTGEFQSNGLSHCIDERIQFDLESGLYSAQFEIDVRDHQLSTELVSKFVTYLRQAFDYVVCDMPAVDSANMARPVFSVFDGTILVLNAETARQEIAQATIRQLKYAGASLLGAILNKRRYVIPDRVYGLL